MVTSSDEEVVPRHKGSMSKKGKRSKAKLVKLNVDLTTYDSEEDSGVQDGHKSDGSEGSVPLSSVETKNGSVNRTPQSKKSKMSRKRNSKTRKNDMESVTNSEDENTKTKKSAHISDDESLTRSTSSPESPKNKNKTKTATVVDKDSPDTADSIPEDDNDISHGKKRVLSESDSDSNERASKRQKKPASPNSGSDEEMDSTVESEVNKKQNELTSDSDSGPDDRFPSKKDQESEDNGPKKEKKSKSAAKRKSKSSSGEQENTKISRLKKCIRTAGLRVIYAKQFGGLGTDSQKIKRLKEILAEAGIEGKPTLQKCKALKRKREEQKEIAELDVSNIIDTNGRGRRSARSVYQSQPAKPAADDTEEGNAMKVFSRLKGVVDSGEESD